MLVMRWMTPARAVRRTITATNAVAQTTSRFSGKIASSNALDGGHGGKFNALGSFPPTNPVDLDNG